MESFKKYISEAKLSRIFQYIQEEDKDFGIVSSFRGEYSKKENLQRHADLKKRVRSMGLGFIEMKGGYIEGDTPVEELSLFLPKVKKNQIIELGKAFGQHSVMFKDSDEFVYNGTNEDAGVGKVLSRFKAKAGKENLDLSKDAIKDFYSQLTKGSHKGKKFVFTMEQMEIYEQEEWNFAKAAYLKRGQQPSWLRII